MAKIYGPQGKPPRNLSVPEEKLERFADRADERVDAFLARVHPWRNRAQFRAMLDDGKVTVNGQVVKRHRRLVINDCVVVEVERQATPDYDAIALPVLYADEQLLFVNKPVGLAAHPVAGHAFHNLLSTLHHQYRNDAWLPQILHRLDENTTGVIVASRNREAHNHVRLQFLRQQTGKIYLAITGGEPPAARDGLIDAPIGTDAANRSQSCITADGRPARSRYQVLAAREGRIAFLVRPLTGRQHQVRIHLMHLGYPLVGDRRYGGPMAPDEFARPALHALCLAVNHPVTGERLTVTAPLPDDMRAALARLGSSEDDARVLAAEMLAGAAPPPGADESVIDAETDPGSDEDCP
ncbi:MAG TPA: RluA family pseudouridine synthase [bacterium]|nr:RluA family pseudouridine synthase [bacterium]